MWANLQMENLMKEHWMPSDPSTAQEIEEMVVFVRRELYNHGMPCKPKVIRNTLDDLYHVTPLPSAGTIARILTRNGLTYGRTGWYEGDEPGGMPAPAGGQPERSHSEV